MLPLGHKSDSSITEISFANRPEGKLLVGVLLETVVC